MAGYLPKLGNLLSGYGISVSGGEFLCMIESDGTLTLVSQSGSVVSIFPRQSQAEPSAQNVRAPLWELVAAKEGGTPTVLVEGTAAAVLATRDKLSRKLRARARLSQNDATRPLEVVGMGLSGMAILVFGFLFGAALGSHSIAPTPQVDAPSSSSPKVEDAFGRVTEDLRHGRKPDPAAVAALPPNLRDILANLDNKPTTPGPVPVPVPLAAPPPPPLNTAPQATRSLTLTPTSAAAATSSAPAEDTAAALSAMVRVRAALTAGVLPNIADVEALPPELRATVRQVIDPAPVTADKPVEQHSSVTPVPPRSAVAPSGPSQLPWSVIAKSAAGDPYGVPSIPDNDMWSSLHKPIVPVPQPSRGIRTIDDLKSFGVVAGTPAPDTP